MEDLIRQQIALQQAILEKLTDISTDIKIGLTCFVVDRETDDPSKSERVTVAQMVDEAIGELDTLGEKYTLGIKLQITGLRTAAAQGALVPEKAIEAADTYINTLDGITPDQIGQPTSADINESVEHASQQ
jgi:hypothetical protein